MKTKLSFTGQMQIAGGSKTRSILFTVAFLTTHLCNAQGTAQSPDVYKGGDGSPLSKQTLTNILADHCLWVESKHAQGRPADLRGADLSGLKIRDIFEVGENGEFIALTEIDFSGTILRGVTFNNCDLKKAHFDRAKLQGANIVYSNLDGAIFDDSDLCKVSFFATDLTGASFVNAKLQNASFALATITGVIYEPKSKSMPDVTSLSNAVGLSDLRYRSDDDLGFGSEAALIELRSALKDAGLREQERQVNYAIQHGRMEGLRRSGGVIERHFRYIFFDLTSKYGMLPGRPLKILGGGIIVFAFPYFIAIYFRRCSKQSGIWVVRIEDTVHRRKRRSRALAVKFEAMPAKTPFGQICQALRVFMRALCAALYFSALSAFSIGFREIDVGSWISRLQSREYTWRATGWVRCVAGFQSLLSVYLLALWLLTYFGRPFE